MEKSLVAAWAVLFVVFSVIRALHQPEDHGVRKLVIQQGGLWVDAYRYELGTDGRLHIWKKAMFDNGREATVTVPRSVFIRTVDMADSMRAKASYRADPEADCMIAHHIIQTEIIWTAGDGTTTSASQMVHCPLGFADYVNGVPGLLKSLVGLSRGHGSWAVWNQRDSVTEYLDSQVPAGAWAME